MMFFVLVSAKKFRVRLASLFCFCFVLFQTSTQAQVAAASLFVRWNPSPDAAVVGYRVYYGVQTGDYTNSLDVGLTTNAVVAGLEQGVTYFFAATGYNTNGDESDFSNEAFASTAGTGNQPPTLDPIANLTLNENASAQVVYLTGISTGATNEVQTLTITATSSNPDLVPAPTVIYASPNSTAALSLAPAPNAYGTAVITVIVNDGSPVNSMAVRTFTISVNQVNQAPTITPILNQNIQNGTTAGPLPFTVGDLETPAGNLILSAVSSNPTLIPVSKITFGGSNASRNVLLAPVAGQSGNATITVIVSDGALATSTSFQLVVRAKPIAPSGLAISAR